MAQAPVTDMLFQALMGLGTMALAGLTWLLTAGGAWVAARIKSQKLRDMWLRADDYATRAVKEVAQAYVAPLKAAGTWDAQSAALAKRMVEDKMRDMLSWKHGVDALSYVFSGDEKALRTFIGTFTESALFDVKSAEGTTQALIASAAPASAQPAAAALKPAVRSDGSLPANPTPAPAVP